MLAIFQLAARVLLTASRTLDPPMARLLFEQAVGDYEKVLGIQVSP